MNRRCQCGCYVPDRCHHCGEPLGDLRNESAELAMLRAQNESLHRALAGMQAIINGRRSGLGEWLREELRVIGWDEKAAVVLVWLALAVHMVAVIAGRWAA